MTKKIDTDKGMQRYEIHVDSFLRMTELGVGIGDRISVPNIEGLDEAVCLVNKACSMELWKRQESELDDFLVKQWNKIKETGLYEGDLTGYGILHDIQKIMKETAEYYKDKK